MKRTLQKKLPLPKVYALSIKFPLNYNNDTQHISGNIFSIIPHFTGKINIYGRVFQFQLQKIRFLKWNFLDNMLKTALFLQKNPENTAILGILISSSFSCRLRTVFIGFYKFFIFLRFNVY